MKRIALLLAALLLLPACAGVEPEPVTEAITETITTTEEETTTEAPVIPFEPTNGESNGVKWRTLDVDSAEGREAQEWLAEQYEQWQNGPEGPTEFPMGKDKTIVLYAKDKIVLRDKAGKETVLLEPIYFGNATTPEKALIDEVSWEAPYSMQALDERYFVYDLVGWEWSGETGIYDTKKMRTIPITWDEKYNHTGSLRNEFSYPQVCADGLYLMDSTYGEYDGPVHLMRVDLSALEKGEDLMAADVLESIPGVQDAKCAIYRLLTQDANYFIVLDITGLRVYDLHQKKLALELTPEIFGLSAAEVEWVFGELALRDNLLYWTDRGAGYGTYLAEITL